MFSIKLHRLSCSLSPIVRQQTAIATNVINENHDKHATETPANGNTNNRCASPLEKTIRDKHLANIIVTSFYCQTAIEQFAAKVEQISWKSD